MAVLADSLSNDDLLAFSGEHLAFEVRMFQDTLWRDRPGEWVLDMALLEAMIVHARTLVDFFYPRGRKKDADVKFYHFLDDGVLWSPRKLSMSLSLLRDRADKEVSHLTTGRISGTPPDKGYKLADLAPLLDILRDFVAVASPRKLHPQIVALSKRTRLVRNSVSVAAGMTYANYAPYQADYHVARGSAQFPWQS